MDFDRHSVGPDDAGRRVDRILRRYLPKVPLSGIYRLIRKGLVRLDGTRVTPDTAASLGSELWIARIDLGATSGPVSPETVREGAPQPPRTGGTSQNASRLPYSVLLETPDLLFVLKNPGVPVHGKGSLDALIPQSRAARESLSFRSGPLHRLDRGTSGLIVFSKTLNGARWFTSLVAKREAVKQYYGIMIGTLEGEREWYDEGADGKGMITFVTPLATRSGSRPRTLALFRILTGRKHQIRYQCARHGFPLEGDQRYNPAGESVQGGYYLHAWRIAFPEGERLEEVPSEVTAPLPARFVSRLEELFGKEALARLEAPTLY